MNTNSLNIDLLRKKNTVKWTLLALLELLTISQEFCPVFPILSHKISNSKSSIIDTTPQLG